MKVSKLFHWLYAVLMFLPLMFFIPSLINNSAYRNNQSYEIQYKYETNEVTSASDLVVGNIYHYERDFTLLETSYTFAVGKGFVNFSSLVTEKTILSNVNELYFDYNGSTHILYVYDNVAPYSQQAIIRCNENNLLSFDFVFTRLYVNDDYSYYSICENVPIVGVDSKNLSIIESIDKSLTEIFNLPLFEWAKDSFIIVPFNYIGNLFGIATGSLVMVMLDYWLAISIIWLCFDLIMYVPLLVHRWIDKGVME